MQRCFSRPSFQFSQYLAYIFKRSSFIDQHSISTDFSTSPKCQLWMRCCTPHTWVSRVDIFASLQETVVIVMSNPLLGAGQLLISSLHITDFSLSIYSSVYAHGQADPMWWSGLPLPMMSSVSHVCVCCFSPVYNKASNSCSVINVLPSFLPCAEAVLSENCCIAIVSIILI